MTSSFRDHLALFGGGFNPPHLGHLEAARGLLKDPAVGEVVILPSFGNPLKPETNSFEHRFEMAQLNFPDFEVSDFERKEKTSSTFELLSRKNQIAGERPIVFAIGTDQFESLESWVNFPNFLGLSDWIVLLRKPKTLDSMGPQLRHFEEAGILKATRDPYTFEIKTGGGARILRLVNTDAPDISSTQIREKFALGKQEEIKKYLNQDVLKYVERNSLYGTKPNHCN